MEEIMRRFPGFTATVAGVLLVATGVWALLDARSFYDAAATFPPYNSHLLHDIGAFLTGLGSALLVGLRLKRGLTVALVANAVAAVLHAISHLADRHLGGKSSDPIVFTVIAIVLVVAAAQALREDSS
jgi:hypothetical protein